MKGGLGNARRCFWIFAILLSFCLVVTTPILGRTLNILTLDFFDPHRKAAELIAQQLQDVGIDAEPLLLDRATFYGRIYDTRDFDMYILSPTPLEPAAGQHLFWLNSLLDVTPGASSTNHVGFRNDEFDRLLNAYSNMSEPEAIQAFHRMQEIIIEELPYIGTMLPQETRIMRSEWEGYFPDMGGGAFYIHNRKTPINLQSTAGKTIFTMAFGADIQTHNPMEASEHRSYLVINTLIYEPIVAFNELMEVVPWLAESWTVSDDGLTYTFKVRNGITWHDSKPFTADDILFSLNYYIDNEILEYSSVMKQIQKVEARPDGTVVLSLKQRDPWFLQGLAVMTILPEHIWADKDAAWQNPEPVGTGPFKFVSHIKDAQIRLVKNESYWQPGKPYLKEFRVQVVPSADMRFLMIKQGDADTERYGSSPAMVQQAEKDENLSVVIGSGYWDQHLGLNLRREPFDNPKFREAIAYAINREQIVAVVMGGWAEPRNIVGQESWHGIWCNSDVTFPPYDPEKARQLLDEMR